MPRPPVPAVDPDRGARVPRALIAAVLAVLLALVLLVAYLATRGDEVSAPGTPSGAGARGILPEGRGILVNPDAPADATPVVVYEDFQCPFCGQLERSVGEGLNQSAEAGDIRLTYHLMSFLDGSLGNDSSTRAANAAVCAADADVFAAWHQAAFADQPEEGEGYTDDQLVGFAEGAGLSGSALTDFTGCVSQGRHLDYVTDMQEAADRDGVSSTPTVVVDGEPLAPEQVQRLIEDPTSLADVLRTAP